MIEWSNNTGSHVVGPRAFHSGERSLADIPLDRLCGPGVVADISDAVADYGLYTPEMITERVEVREGDILVVNTGYHRYAWDEPDVPNPDAQGGIENKEFGYYVRHPGPSPDFFPWALDHRALRLKAAETYRSLSELVNEAVQLTLAEDAEDLAAFEERASEPNLPFESVVRDLKRRGKI